MENINNIYSSKLFEKWSLIGVEDVVVSPGSRSGALAIEAENNNLLNTHIVIDERSAAFYALGIARVKQVPTVLICTSGSALAHYFPAVMEAYEDKIPLIVCSSDRVPEEIDVGAWQATRQQEFYSNFVRWFHHVEINNNLPLRHMGNIAKQSFYKSLSPIAGPIHINIAMRAPLWDVENSLKNNFSKKVLNKFDYTNFNFEQIVINLKSKNGIVYVGRNSPIQEDVIKELSNQLCWDIYSNPLSNINLGNRDINKILDLDVQNILRFGELPVSRKLYEKIGNIKNTIAIVQNGYWSDPFNVDVKHIFFGKQIDGKDYKKALFIGNSSIIRDFEDDTSLFGDLLETKVFSQRGLAGIDGFISTLAGIASTQKFEMVTGICGDITFLHDFSAINLLKESKNVELVVVDSNGGKLFSNLPSADSSNIIFQKLFTTPHNLDLNKIVIALELENKIRIVNSVEEI